MRPIVAGMSVLMLAGCAHMADSGAEGGATARPLAGTQWTIASINGAAPTAERKTAMKFTAERLSGNAGCNSFGAGYTLADDVLTATQVVSTKMACMGAGMTQEAAVFKILGEPMTVAWQADGSLTLSDAGGTMTLVPEG